MKLVKEALEEPMESVGSCFKIWDPVRRVVIIDQEIDDSIRELGSYLVQWSLEDFSLRDEEKISITIFIDSIGGDWSAARSIVSLIESSSTPVTTVALQNCCSAAVDIFLAGGYKYAMPNTEFLIHDGYVSYDGSFMKAKSSMDLLDARRKRIMEEICTKTDIDRKTLEEKWDKDWYFDAEEAIEMHVADEILLTLDDLWQ